MCKIANFAFSSKFEDFIVQSFSVTDYCCRKAFSRFIVTNVHVSFDQTVVFFKFKKHTFCRLKMIEKTRNKALFPSGKNVLYAINGSYVPGEGVPHKYKGHLPPFMPLGWGCILVGGKHCQCKLCDVSYKHKCKLPPVIFPRNTIWDSKKSSLCSQSQPILHIKISHHSL